MSREPVPFEADGWRGLAVPDLLSWVRATVLPDPESVARGGEILRESRNRVTARIVGAEGTPLLLKAHRVRKRREAWLSHVRPSRAREEFDACRWLEARGIPAPQALGMGELREGGRLRRAFLLTTWLDGHVALRTVLAEGDAASRMAVLEQTAALVRRSHDEGFDHRDLHAENVMVGADGPVLVDLHRHRRDTTLSGEARARALAQLIHDLGGGLAPAEREVLLHAYGPLDHQIVQADVERRERIRRRSRAKRCLLESTVYTRDVGETLRGARRLDVSPERLEAVLDAHDVALRANDRRVLKRGGRSAVTAHGDLVVKEALDRTTIGRLRSRLVPGRATAGYRHAHLLDVLGVTTARPYAWLRREGRTFTLVEDLSALPRLDHLVRLLYRDGDPRASVLRDAVAAWLGALHARGIYHGDLKGVNILVREQDGMFELALIDTDRVLFFDHPVDRRRRVKNLGQLAASIPRRVTRAERLRWYRRYRDALGIAEDEKALARDVEAVLRGKQAVVDEPIE